MRLNDFLARFSQLSDDAFVEAFPHPFLLEAGQVLGDGANQSERQVFPLRDHEEPILVGRKNPADVLLKLPSISGRHAQLLPPHSGSGTWRLRDLGSTNGTFLEGVKLQPKQPVALSDGAALRFGPDARFTYLERDRFLRVYRRMLEADDDVEVISSEGSNPLLNETDHGLGSDSPLSDSSAIEQAEGPRGKDLMIVCDPFDAIPLKPGQTVIVGRSPKTARMVLPHKNVSRRHVEIERRGDEVWVRDLGSANGTSIGKTRVGREPVELFIGKVMVVGPYRVTISGPLAALTHTSIVKPEADGLKTPKQGQISDVPVLDIFNQIEIAQATGTLRIECGRLRATITFRSGEPVEASTNKNEQGDDAVRLVLSLDKGEFWLNTDAKVIDADASRRVTRTFSELALDDFFDGS